jgi:hypothetical protein
VFFPYFTEEKAKKIVFEEDVGMQVSHDKVTLHPKALIIMGGLAMPNVPVTITDARIVITRHHEAVTLGICFMQMFEKAGWRKEIKYDLFIDTSIDPVIVETQTMTLSERSQYLINLYNLTHPGSENKQMLLPVCTFNSYGGSQKKEKILLSGFTILPGFTHDFFNLCPIFLA